MDAAVALEAEVVPARARPRPLLASVSPRLARDYAAPAAACVVCRWCGTVLPPGPRVGEVLGEHYRFSDEGCAAKAAAAALLEDLAAAGGDVLDRDRSSMRLADIAHRVVEGTDL